jgi:hypothetical protein
MPLKGVLLQGLVYRDRSFRPIRDVDLLVPEARFLDACAALRAAGFSRARWEPGRWQVTLSNPDGPPLGVDLHRRLTRTSRSHLTSNGLFERGKTDTKLFGVPVVVPSAADLFAHLLLHATLHWIRFGQVHRPADFQEVAAALSLDAGVCAEHLRHQGLIPHALVMLPLILDHTETRGAFITALMPRLHVTPRATAAASIVRAVTSRFGVGHPPRRLAGLALAPSLSGALVSAFRDRLNPPEQGARDDSGSTA